MTYKACICDIGRESLVGKYVFVRADFNVPMVETIEGMKVADNSRITATLPTLRFLSRIVVCSHLGRPRGKNVGALSLAPVASEFRTIPSTDNITLHFVNECIGDLRLASIQSLRNGEALLLENVRFHKEEEANDDVFAQLLAAGMDIYVNDAFGSAHRGNHGSQFFG